MSVKYSIYNVDTDFIGYHLEPKKNEHGIFECSEEKFSKMRQTIEDFEKLQGELLNDFDEQFTKPDEDEKT